MDTADRDSPREHDAQQSTGAARAESVLGIASAITMSRRWIGSGCQVPQSGMAEVELGRNGRRVVDDYSKTNDKLKTRAARQGIDLPGQAFDRAYMSEMVQVHQHAVEHFQKGSTRLRDADRKQFASTTFPTLKDHLTEAQSMAAGCVEVSNFDY